jgi:hypothetical protein
LENNFSFFRKNGSRSININMQKHEENKQIPDNSFTVSTYLEAMRDIGEVIDYPKTTAINDFDAENVSEILEWMDEND